MEKKLTEEQIKFLEETMKHRKEKVEGLTYSCLALALKANLPVFDVPYYVLQRTRQVIEEAFKTIDFDSPEIRKAQMEFFKACLKKMKKNVVVAEKKEEKDETDVRDNRCEPIVQELVQLVLDEDLIFSDGKYFDAILKNEASIPLSAAIGGYQDALDEKMTMVISEHWRRCQDIFWGVAKEDVTFEQMDVILKRVANTEK